VVGAPGAVLLGGVVHVYAASGLAFHLIEFDSDHAAGRIWNAYDETANAGAAQLGGSPIPVLIGSVPHVYTDDLATGDLVEYVADHAGGQIWNDYNQTQANGAPRLSGNPSAVVVDGSQYPGAGSLMPEVFEQGQNRHLTAVVADHQNSHIWNSYDVSSLSAGPMVSTDPTVLITPSGVEVLAIAQQG
jgi:hypothetical protein